MKAWANQRARKRLVRSRYPRLLPEAGAAACIGSRVGQIHAGGWHCALCGHRRQIHLTVGWTSRCCIAQAPFLPGNAQAFYYLCPCVLLFVPVSANDSADFFTSRLGLQYLVE